MRRHIEDGEVHVRADIENGNLNWSYVALNRIDHRHDFVFDTRVCWVSAGFIPFGVYRLYQCFQLISVTRTAVDAGDIAFACKSFGNGPACGVTCTDDERGLIQSFSSVHCSGC